MAFQRMIWKSDDGSLKVKVKARIRNASTALNVTVRTSIRNGQTSNTNTNGNNQ